MLPNNPTVCPDEDLVISAGNFHGEPIAQPMDFLAIALCELSNISERRIYKLVSGTRDLPSFLVAKPGVNSGFMIPQYTAASIVSQSKMYCHLLLPTAFLLHKDRKTTSAWVRTQLQSSIK